METSVVSMVGVDCLVHTLSERQKRMTVAFDKVHDVPKCPSERLE